MIADFLIIAFMASLVWLIHRSNSRQLKELDKRLEKARKLDLLMAKLIREGELSEPDRIECRQLIIDNDMSILLDIFDQSTLSKVKI